MVSQWILVCGFPSVDCTQWLVSGFWSVVSIQWIPVCGFQYSQCYTGMVSGVLVYLHVSLVALF